MSFKPFNPFEEKEPSFWKQVLMATLPVFVASVMPPVVMHFLEKRHEEKQNKKNEANSKDETK